ncbi:MAG: hypothetical protein ABI076_02470, partial [Acidobacteriaceae bacterium]
LEAPLPPWQPLVSQNRPWQKQTASTQAQKAYNMGSKGVSRALLIPHRAFNFHAPSRAGDSLGFLFHWEASALAELAWVGVGI